LPAKASFDANGEAGHRDIMLSGLVALPDARFAGTALAETDVTERNVSQDPTPFDPYDSFAAGAFQRTVVVPAGAGVPYRLLVEATSDVSSDIDLFVGQDFDGNGASASEVRCTSATAGASERCLLTIEGTAAEQTFWMVAQNYSSPDSSIPVRMESTLFDMRTGNDGTLVATGPGHADVGEAFDLRIAWNDPTMVPGAIRRGYVLLGTGPERLGMTAALLVEVRRSATGAPAAVALQPGLTRRMRLGGGAAQDRLYVDVPANASKLAVTMTGVGNVDLYAAHAPGSTGPLIAAAPPRTAAQASSTGTGASETVTVAGAALAPGRWYITPVNTGAVEARANLTATLEYGAALRCLVQRAAIRHRRLPLRGRRQLGGTLVRLPAGRHPDLVPGGGAEARCAAGRVDRADGALCMERPVRRRHARRRGGADVRRREPLHVFLEHRRRQRQRALHMDRRRCVPGRRSGRPDRQLVCACAARLRLQHQCLCRPGDQRSLLL
jgi:hypothetical protein